VARIDLKNINKIYPGNITAVSDFNLAIEDKEFIILVGPSGCGKSTTLRMIAGLEEITKGELYIGDRLVNNVLPKDRDIAMVFQNYALYPHMTVYKNMAFGLRMRKIPKDEIDVKVREAAKLLDIEHLLNRMPKTLSGGQRQRVALGRAMVRDPSVFLLDEPLSNLDAKLRVSMRAEITKLHKSLGTTFIYVTHDQTEAMTMGDRIVVMKGGVIQQVDTPQKLYDHPRNLFVAGFIGSPRMNFIDVVISKVENDYYASFGKFNILIPEDAIPADICGKYLGELVTLGVRPEFIENRSDSMKFFSLIKGNVDLVELMGAEKYVYFDCEGNKLIAKVSGRSEIKDGDSVELAVDCTGIHLFEKDTELCVEESQT